MICLILRSKLRFLGFLSVFCTFLHKVLQTWFVCHESWHTTLFGIYIIMLKWLESIKIVMCLKLRAKLRFLGFFSVIGNFSHEVVQTCFFAMKLGTQHYLVYIIVLKCLES